MDIKLHDRQSTAFSTVATELLYGGAAGGGKSYFLRVSAIRWALAVPGIQIYLFRRTYPDLRANHLRGPTSFFVLMAEMLESQHILYRKTENEFIFWNGSVLRLAHCASENDVEKYQGAEIHVLLVDELTHFTEYQYRFMRGRVRAPGLIIPEQYSNLIPRVECGSNPGSVGHAHVKRSFVNPKAPEEIWQTPPDEGGMLRQYIPAKMSDNPTLMIEDPTYLQRLEGLGTPELVRAMRDGDWDIVAGQAFEKLRRDLHCLRPFKPAEHLLKFRSMDWGSSKPFSVGWWCVSDGNMKLEGINGQILRPARGALIRYRDWYGWNKRPDVGLRMEVDAVAQGILDRTPKDEEITYTVSDPAMWKVDGGPSHAENMGRMGLRLKRADNSRHAGYLQVRNRVAGDDELGPMLYATETCHDGFWRTMPDLVMDEHDPEDVDTDLEDHCYDEVRYACMSRPWTKLKPEIPPDIAKLPTFDEAKQMHERARSRKGKKRI